MNETSNRLLATAGSLEAAHYRAMVARYGSPLLMLYPGRLQGSYHALAAALPGVELHYAVKALPEPRVLQALDACGSRFDVASSGETGALAALGVDGSRLIHTHPMKKTSEIVAALDYGIELFVVDNLEEAEKFAPWRDRVRLLVRLSFRGGSVRVDLSRKFGCPAGDAAELVRAIRQRGFSVAGMSFHVGSQSATPAAHVAAIDATRRLMTELNREPGAPLDVLDIGGGFPADYEMSGLCIDAFCAPLRQALAECPPHWRLIAEPGRCIAAPAVTGVATVVGRAVRDGRPWYYLDDGVYGSYSGRIYDHAGYPLQLLVEGETVGATLAGPTCDSIDIIAEDIAIPELAIGELVIGHCLGAYSMATRTTFNSLAVADFVISEEDPLALTALPEVRAA